MSFVDPRDPTIQGHPAVPLVNDVGDVIQMVTVCAECGAMRSVIYMSEGNRVNGKAKWFCLACRAAGNAQPTMFPLN